MSENNIEFENNREPGVSRVRLSSDGSGAPKRRRLQSSSTSSVTSAGDSSDVDEVKRSGPGESDFNFQELLSKVNILTSVLLQNVILPSSLSQKVEASTRNDHLSGPALITQTAFSEPVQNSAPSPKQIPSVSAFSNFPLHHPAATMGPSTVEPRLLSLRAVDTSLKDPRTPRAIPEHLKRVEALQRFSDPSWKDVRYADALKLHCASPGFVDLDINDELRQFVKGKDYTASSEKVIAAICNGLITQQKLLNDTLQQFINWTVSNDTVLSANNIFDKITDLFKSTSKFHKINEEIMQMVCGKRAEYIETRRERILSEIANKNLREGLRKIPPSSKYLFDEPQLRAYVQNTGGIDKWVRPWFPSDRDSNSCKQKNAAKVHKSGPSRDFRSQPFRSNEGDRRNKVPFAGPSKPQGQEKSNKGNRKSNKPNKKRFDK
jgi:hypothetical protein